MIFDANGHPVQGPDTPPSPTADPETHDAAPPDTPPATPPAAPEDRTAADIFTARAGIWRLLAELERAAMRRGAQAQLPAADAAVLVRVVISAVDRWIDAHRVPDANGVFPPPLPESTAAYHERAIEELLTVVALQIRAASGVQVVGADALQALGARPGGLVI